METVNREEESLTSPPHNNIVRRGTLAPGEAEKVQQRFEQEPSSTE